ncbi:MAG: hypothetical protein HZA88_15285 [Verrucomicrobia bacterium]|nr:hypothetical protein [Verrucomicrobiota bacterium]
MNRTEKKANRPTWAASVRTACLAVVAAACAGSLAVAADEASATATNTVSATSASSLTSAVAEPLPLMIPDETWKRLTLTADQQAQLQALQTALYADQLATIRSLTAQAEPLRVALAAARQTAGQDELVAKLKGQILELTWPLVTRYDRFVCEAGWLLDTAQRAELAKMAKDVLAEKRLAVLVAKLGLGTGVQLSPTLLAALGPLDSIPAAQDDDSDALPTVWELKHELKPLDSTDTGVDTDGDGLVNYMEYLLGIDPQDSDDTDSLPSEWKTKLDERSRIPSDPNSNQDQKNKKASTGGGRSSSGSSTDGSGASTTGVRISVQIVSPADGTVVK